MRESIKYGNQTHIIQPVYKTGSLMLRQEITGASFRTISRYLPKRASVTLTAEYPNRRIIQDPPVEIYKIPRKSSQNGYTESSDGLFGLEIGFDDSGAIQPPNALELVNFAKALGWDIAESVWQAVGQSSLA